MQKKAIPIVAYMAVHNGAEYIRESIESTINMVDRFIVIEGAWGENVAVNGYQRSTDGTIQILENLKAKYSKLEVHHHNDPNQIAQRNRVFEYLPNDCWLFIVDHDEVWDKKNLANLWTLLQQTKEKAIKVKSLTFVNDRYTYAPIAFPRCFRIEPGHSYLFSAPNHLVCDTRSMEVTPHENIIYYHYSYCHSPERFLEKKRERTKLHGHFPWQLENGQVVRKEANLKFFDDDHPESMANHPLMSRKPNRVGDHYVIVQHSGIGNLVHVTPLCLALREMFPTARISILTWPRSARILEGWPIIDEVYKGNPISYFRQLKSPVKEVFVSPVGALPLPQDLPINKLEFKAPWIMHETEYHMEFARALGWNKESPLSEVHINKSNYENAKRKIEELKLQDKKILFVNASYLKSDHWYKKHWGNHNYANLLKWFIETYRWPIIFGGTQNDRKDANEIIELIQKESFPPIDKELITNLCGWSDDIKDTAAILENCSLVIGNDGGLQHIAAAVDTPTVTVFTFTNHVKNASIHELSEVAMYDCDKRLMCQHGIRHFHCQCLNVPIETVKDKVSKVIYRL